MDYVALAQCIDRSWCLFPLSSSAWCFICRSFFACKSSEINRPRSLRIKSGQACITSKYSDSLCNHVWALPDVGMCVVCCLTFLQEKLYMIASGYSTTKFSMRV